MKAVYGYVRQVKKHLTTGEAIVEVQIDATGYKEAVQLLDSQPVLVTLAGDIKGGYGVIDEDEVIEKIPSKKFTELRPSAQAAIRCKDEVFRNWLKVGSEDEAIKVIRSRCNIKSRAELDVPGAAQNSWGRLSNQYWAETRYPDHASFYD